MGNANLIQISISARSIEVAFSEESQKNLGRFSNDGYVPNDLCHPSWSSTQGLFGKTPFLELCVLASSAKKNEGEESQNSQCLQTLPDEC